MLFLPRNLQTVAPLGLVAFVTLVGSFSIRQSFAAENSLLADEALSQIVADEVADRLAKYLEANRIQTVKTVLIEGEFRSLTSQQLSQQLTHSLQNRAVEIDEGSNTRLTGEILLSESDDVVCILMLCTLSDVNSGEMCTVRIRKVLPSSNRS